MADRAQILKCIYAAANETNDMLPPESKLQPTEAEFVMGEQAKIDSLGFVTLLVYVEREIEGQFGKCPNLAEEITNAEVELKTMGDLATFIAGRM